MHSERYLGASIAILALALATGVAGARASPAPIAKETASVSRFAHPPADLRTLQCAAIANAWFEASQAGDTILVTLSIGAANGTVGVGHAIAVSWDGSYWSGSEDLGLNGFVLELSSILDSRHRTAIVEMRVPAGLLVPEVRGVTADGLWAPLEVFSCGNDAIYGSGPSIGNAGGPTLYTITWSIES